MTPNRVAKEPRTLRAGFFRLVEVSSLELAVPGEGVWNTYWSNISFQRSVLVDRGGLISEMIRQGEQSLETHETEFFARMGNALGFNVGYVPRAIFDHKVFKGRTHKRRLVPRALWQGYSKRAIERLSSRKTRAKKSRYPRQLLNTSVPQRIAQLVRRPDLTGLTQLVSLGVLTFSVGLGYLYGVLRW